MNKYVYALGRRKTATATVRLFPSGGESTVNGKPVNEVFPTDDLMHEVMAPFRTLDLKPNTLMFTAMVSGGGTYSQVGAVKLALARCLSKQDAAYHKPLKDAGLLTRDPRMVERKKTGRRKARKSEQYSKR